MIVDTWYAHASLTMQCNMHCHPPPPPPRHTPSTLTLQVVPPAVPLPCPTQTRPSVCPHTADTTVQAPAPPPPTSPPPSRTPPPPIAVLPRIIRPPYIPTFFLPLPPSPPPPNTTPHTHPPGCTTSGASAVSHSNTPISLSSYGRYHGPGPSPASANLPTPPPLLVLHASYARCPIPPAAFPHCMVLAAALHDCRDSISGHRCPWCWVGVGVGQGGAWACAASCCCAAAQASGDTGRRGRNSPGMPQGAYRVQLMGLREASIKSSS